MGAYLEIRKEANHGMGFGYIPLRSIRDWVEVYEMKFGKNEMAFFIRIIRALENVDLTIYNNKKE